jgi:hypothetical protein
MIRYDLDTILPGWYRRIVSSCRCLLQATGLTSSCL